MASGATGSTGAGDGSSSSTQPPEPNPPAGPRFQPWRRWQTATRVAVIGAAGAVAAALVTAIAGGLISSGPNHGRDPRPPEVSIASWTETRAASSSTSWAYVFHGSVINPPKGAEVRVIIRLPETKSAPAYGAPKGTKWLVSPKADLLSGGTWKIAWTLEHQPPAGRWLAVLSDNRHLYCNCPEDEILKALRAAGSNAGRLLDGDRAASTPQESSSRR